MKKMVWVVFFMLLAFLLPADQPDISGMLRPFQWLEAALKTDNEALFRTHWQPAGYMENLLGTEEFSGHDIFIQWKANGWYFKPDSSKLQQDGRGGPYILYCDIWSWDQNASVGEVWALPVYVQEKKIWTILAVSSDYQAIVYLSRQVPLMGKQ